MLVETVRIREGDCIRIQPPSLLKPLDYLTGLASELFFVFNHCWKCTPSDSVPNNCKKRSLWSMVLFWRRSSSGFSTTFAEYHGICSIIKPENILRNINICSGIASSLISVFLLIISYYFFAVPVNYVTFFRNCVIIIKNKKSYFTLFFIGYWIFERKSY